MSPTYFMFPVDAVPMNLGSPVWFATWSTRSTSISWSQQKPPTPDEISTWAVGVAASATVPDGATLLGSGGKDLPPPPLALSSPSSPTAFQDAFRRWLTTARSA